MALDIIAIVSLTILGISMLVLVISMVPLLSQLNQLLQSLNQTVTIINDKVLPNVADFSDVLKSAKKIIDKGQNIGDKINKSASALTEGIKTGIQSYFKSGSQK
jgi:uncharacterized protein YoxC